MSNHTAHTDEFSRIAVSDRKRGLDLLVSDTRGGLSVEQEETLKHIESDGHPRHVAFAARQRASARTYAVSAPTHRATGSRFAP